MTQEEAMALVRRITYRPGWNVLAKPVPRDCLTLSCRAFVIDSTATEQVAVMLSEGPAEDWTINVGRDYVMPRQPRLRHEPDPLGAMLGSQRTISLADLAEMGERDFLEWVRDFLRSMEMHELDEFLCLDGEPIFDPHDVEQREAAAK